MNKLLIPTLLLFFNTALSIAQTATISGPTQVCQDEQNVVITFTGANGAAPYTFNYTINSGPIQSTQASTGNTVEEVVAFNTTTSSTQTFNYQLVSVQDNSGSTQSTSGSVTLTVNPTPTVNAAANQQVCSGDQSTAVNYSGSVAGTTFSWVNNNTTIGLSASGNGSIAAFTAQPVSATQVATITVTPLANGCVGENITFTYTIEACNVGVATMEISNVEIFPNPCVDQINIKSNNQISHLELVSLDGVRLESLKFMNDYKMDLSNYSTGVYLLLISFQDGSQVIKRIKKD